MRFQFTNKSKAIGHLNFNGREKRPFFSLFEKIEKTY